MASILYPTVALLAAIALAYKLPALRRDPGSPTRRALASMLLFLIWAPAVNTPAVYLAFDRLTGVPNLARLIAHCGILGFAASVQILLLHWTVSGPRPRRTRLRLLTVAVAAAAMTVFFVLAPVDVSTTDFTTRYGDAPWITEYMLVYLGYFTVALVDIMRLSWRFANLTSRTFLRAGLRLVTVGGGFGVVYTVEKALYIVARGAGVTLVPAGVQESLSPVLTATGSLLMLIGLTIPSWGPRVAGVVTRVRRYVTFRQLEPLWSLMRDATPEITLEATARRGLGDLEYRLVRRVVEIRDGGLALRPYLDTRVAAAVRQRGAAAGLAPEQVHAGVQAALFSDAARAKTQGRTPPEVYEMTAAGGTDLDGEIVELVRVARALKSPVVRETVR
ncbi:MAB_1171c family putative transporter [Actinoplanes sp. NPDC051494]|uniref:MAB_1171c family putative transporter n=1 Tax=Actinoplanes sp. NPDC051494 TaxID=3363907 RepID=UPI0037931F6B